MNSIGDKKSIADIAVVMIAAILFLFVVFAAGCKEVCKKEEKNSEEVCENTKETQKGIIVIDAGHGGSDPGKIAVDNSKEKDINLEIATKLKTELEDRGYVVVMTRTEDVDLSISGASNKKRSDMNSRISIINESNADYLISIHQNSFTSNDVKGAQVFYYGESEESKKLAETIMTSIKADVDTTNTREAKTGNDYFILKKSVMPGVIVECGFLSNIEETARLKDANYQTKIVKAIADSIDLCKKIKSQ